MEKSECGPIQPLRIDCWRIYCLLYPCSERHQHMKTETSTAASKSDYEGKIDRADYSNIAGWAWNKNQPDSPIQVDLYNADLLIGTVTADLFRKDLLNARIGNGRHGFVLTTPASLKDGKPHSISLR